MPEEDIDKSGGEGRIDVDDELEIFQREGRKATDYHTGLF